MLTTTLNNIRAQSPCREGWSKLLAHLGKTQADDEPVAYATILASNGLNDALWCCRAEPRFDKHWRLFAVWCARQVEHLNTDPRVKTCNDIAERYANGEAIRQELEDARAAAHAARAAARSAARSAARAADAAAAYAAYAAADAADAAADAADAAAAYAAYAAADAARDAARAARAADAAADAAYAAAAYAAYAAADAARDAARAARAAQSEQFLKIVNEA